MSFSLSSLDRTCPDDCTNPSQGICDTSTGICDCKPGFAGLNCAGNIKHYTYKKFWSWKTERTLFYLISFSNSNFIFTEACTVNQITSADICQDCSAGEVPDVMSNLTACVACNPEEITNNGSCQACPEGQVPNANQTVCEVALSKY